MRTLVIDRLICTVPSNRHMARIEGTATSITAARSSTESLRTTIPAWVVKHMALAKGDRVDWTLDKDGNVWMVKVEKKAGA